MIVVSRSFLTPLMISYGLNEHEIRQQPPCAGSVMRIHIIPPPKVTG